MKVFLFLIQFMLQAYTHIGGQAVMGGLIMRNGNTYALAVRNDKNEIIVEHHTWFSLSNNFFLQKKFFRGFPLLLETLINGIRALNRSNSLMESEQKRANTWQIMVSLFLAVFLAIFLFVIIPHFFALIMEYWGLSGNINKLSFHLWDGIFKIILFLAYIWLISFIPDIRDVLQYHGAEHKVITCYESGMPVNAYHASLCTRLHPRCGTSFIFFVLLIAIAVHSIFVPLILFFPLLENNAIIHSVVILFKIVLIIPISALAYELIRTTARKRTNPLTTMLVHCGLFLQRLTTKEPSTDQLEVAVIALYEVLDEKDCKQIETVPYTILD